MGWLRCSFSRKLIITFLGGSRRVMTRKLTSRPGKWGRTISAAYIGSRLVGVG